MVTCHDACQWYMCNAEIYGGTSSLVNSLSLSLSLTHTHTHTRTKANTISMCMSSFRAFVQFISSLSLSFWLFFLILLPVHAIAAVAVVAAAAAGWTENLGCLFNERGNESERERERAGNLSVERIPISWEGGFCFSFDIFCPTFLFTGGGFTSFLAAKTKK